MFKKFIVLAIVISSFISGQDFKNYFFDKTLRLDYVETGDSESSIFSIDEMIEEPYWGGSKVNLIDTLQYGNYFFEVYDKTNGELIYSRGYSTLFQEWQTTEEAKETRKSFPGSVVFPYPQKTVKIIFYKRNRNVKFVKEFSYEIDPNSYKVKKEKKLRFPNFKIINNGDPSEKYDFVFIPEGYSADEMDDFKNDCKKFAGYLFKYSPYKEHKNDINIWGIDAPSDESGTDVPGKNIWKCTLLNSNFYTFGSERYVMTSDYKTVRDVASNAPYDQIVILVNTKKYGGGGIYNFYSLTVSKHATSEKIFIHELGHGVAGLADEYYTSDVAYSDFYPSDVEPWEQNITTLKNFELKWKNLVDEDTPIPTPATEQYKNIIGVFEGGGYSANGVYRSSINSIMLELSEDGYNYISERAIENVLKFNSK